MSETPDPSAVEKATEASAGGGKRRATFNTLAVSEVRKLTPDSVEVTFEVPEDLVADYNDLPGQYVAIRSQINGWPSRRTWAACSPRGRTSSSPPGTPWT